MKLRRLKNAAGLAGVLGLLVAAVPLGATAVASGVTDPEVNKELARAREATALFHRESAAIAAGFTRTEVCIARRPENGGGVMGYHYNNRARFDRELDIEKPEAVLYQQSDDGSKKLVAVEYFLIDADQDLRTNEQPVLFGQRMQGPMLGHEPWMAVHYDLHVWAWQHNAAGTFAQWNPDASCPESDTAYPPGP